MNEWGYEVIQENGQPTATYLTINGRRVGEIKSYELGLELAANLIHRGSAKSALTFTENDFTAAQRAVELATSIRALKAV